MQPELLHNAVMQANATSNFETTIVTATMPEAEAINSELKATVLRQMQSDAGVVKSNVAGWQSNPDMLSGRWGGEASIAVVQLALNLCARYSYDRKGADQPRFEWTADMWANVSGAGASNNWHVHPQAFWSAVYYVDDGYAGTDSAAAGGELVFQDPRYPMNRMFSNDLLMRSTDGTPQEEYQIITPKAGMLVAFPAWLFHKVQPYHGSNQRISLAINMTVMPARTQENPSGSDRPAWR